MNSIKYYNKCTVLAVNMATATILYKIVTKAFASLDITPFDSVTAIATARATVTPKEIIPINRVIGIACRIKLEYCSLVNTTNFIEMLFLWTPNARNACFAHVFYGCHIFSTTQFSFYNSIYKYNILITKKIYYWKEDLMKFYLKN